MKPICYFVSRRLAALTGNQEPPRWVARHIDICESCRHERAQYSQMRDLLRRSLAVEEDCILTWENLQARLAEAPSRPDRLARVPAFALAAGMVLVVAIAFVAMLSYPVAKPHSVETVAKNRHAPSAHKPICITSVPSQPAEVKSLETEPRLENAVPNVRRSVESSAVRPRKAASVCRVESTKTHEKMAIRRKLPSVDEQVTQSERKSELPSHMSEEVGYKIGKLFGQTLLAIADNVRPVVNRGIGDEIKRLIPITHNNTEES